MLRIILLVCCGLTDTCLFLTDKWKFIVKKISPVILKINLSHLMALLKLLLREMGKKEYQGIYLIHLIIMVTAFNHFTNIIIAMSPRAFKVNAWLSL